IQLSILQRARIRLQRDLGVDVHVERVTRRRQQERRLLGAQEAGRTTAKEDGARAALLTVFMARPPSRIRYLVAQRRDKRLTQAQDPSVGGEVAVVAFDVAERDVEVERDAVEKRRRWPVTVRAICPEDLHFVRTPLTHIFAWRSERLRRGPKKK